MFSKSFCRILALTAFLISANGHAEVILGADANSVSTKATNIEKEYSQDMRDERLSTTYPTTLKMREKLRVGAGISVGGQLGMIGGIGELNIEDADSAIAGFGTGPSYNSVQFGWKHAMDGDYLAPYFSASYSRWYSSSGGPVSSSSGVLNRVLTESEKRSGHFGTDFLNAAAGLQYNQLSGDFAGISVFAELVGMYEVKTAQLIPSGTVGALYYF